MRNKYPGVCYRCGETVAAGDGHFELLGRKFRVQHATCAIANKGVPDAARIAQQDRVREVRAGGTGKRAQRARAEIRRRSPDGAERVHTSSDQEQRSEPNSFDEGGAS